MLSYERNNTDEGTLEDYVRKCSLQITVIGFIYKSDEDRILSAVVVGFEFLKIG
jgi:hypothetical protein